MSEAGIDIPTLYVNNPQINDDCTNIYVGQVLCTVNYTCVPPVNGALDVLAEIPVTALAANPPAATPAPEAESGSGGEETDAEWEETPVGEENSGETSGGDGNSEWTEEDEENLPFCDEIDY